ncbi:hypothetical protein [Streptomyces chartreusis]|uniref:hypothetical protein n=1 Tax=Streptomyces chartreusis TaxID=1969 RepID=UPI0036402B05
MSEQHQHEPGHCFCARCTLRARRMAVTLYGFIGREPGGTTTDVKAWCPWCARFHSHGDSSSKPGDVLHRFPHCPGRDNPYREYGYLIAVTNIPYGTVRGRMRKSSQKQWQTIQDGGTSPAIERLREQQLPLIQDELHGGWGDAALLRDVMGSTD